MAKQPSAKKVELHPDVRYVEQEEIGKVICEGLAAIVKAQPKNPVEYLARWLLAYEERDKVQQEVRACVDSAVGSSCTAQGDTATGTRAGRGEG